ncbi:MAG: hypothetical protein RMJ98_18215, partial [Myxococcales bacterium]|nr:hypothetical protein [Polyangiaceae bacterium]MDW8251234.1 hypothetical protein [Myxococcales bacterium]
PYMAPFLWLLACGGGGESASEAPPLAQVNAAIVSGSPDATGIPIGTYGCSAVLIAPRTMLTSAHCFPWLAAGCTTLATNPINVYFPEDGVPNPDNAAARTVGVQSVRVNPLAIADLSSCPANPTCQANALTCADRNANCPQTTPPAAVATAFVDRSNDHALLFLNADPPPDVQPMQVVVHPDYAKNSTSFVSFSGIETWALEQTPNVTIAGSGAGTSVYTSPTTGAQVTGKDAGISQWIGTLFTFGDRWTGCNQVVQGTPQPAIQLRSPDLTIAGIDAAWTCPPQPPGQPALASRLCPPPGAQVPGANTSAAGPGDSGGPVLVGDDGSVYKTLRATPLPPPAAGDTYQLNRRYVAGLAEWNRTETNNGGTLVAGDVYTPTYTIQASFFLSSWLVDTDKDGIPDEADPFPTCSSNTDVDGDGVCDQEDICPCTALDQNPAFSDDKDGHCGPCDPALSGAVLPTGKTCATWCTDFVHDLCPGVFDVYGNDNEDSERVWDAKPLGNACDPVPVPDFVPKWGEVVGQAVTSGGSGTGNWLVTKKYVRASAIEHRLRGSFGALDSPIPGQGKTVVVPNTYHRFCLDKKIDNVVDIKCALDDTIADDFLTQNATRSQETILTRWHRVTMQGSFAGPTGSWENPSLKNFTYQPSPNPFSLSWRLVDDFNAWINTTWGQELQLEIPSSTKTWPGRFWMHSNSLVGLSTNIGTGLHKKNNGDPGEQLSNHYELLDPIQLQETATVWDIPMYMPAFPWSFCPACVAELPPLGGEDCPMCKGLLPGSLLDHPYEVQLLAKLPPLPDFPFQYAVVLKDGSFYRVDDKLGTGLKQALSDPTQVWAEQTESLSYLGRGASLPTALALSADGRAITERVFLRGHRFLGQRDRGRTGAALTAGEEPSETLPSGEPLASPSPTLQPSERTSFLPVYSRYLGRLFVVGGQNPENASPRGDIWWQDVEGATSWHRLPDQGYTVGKVLAATYSFRDDRLWVLDEVQGPPGWKRVRLVRIHPQSGEFEQLGQWPRIGLFNRHWLGVDRDGQVLLTASSDTAKKYLVIRLDNRAPQVKPSSVRFGQGVLALRPLVDQDGYSFVLRETKKNRPPTKTERSKTLGGIPAAWSHLNGCW